MSQVIAFYILLKSAAASLAVWQGAKCKHQKDFFYVALQLIEDFYLAWGVRLAKDGSLCIYKRPITNHLEKKIFQYRQRADLELKYHR